MNAYTHKYQGGGDFRYPEALLVDRGMGVALA